MEKYDSPGQEVIKQLPLPGNSGSTPLCTPTTATGTGTSTRVTTLDAIGFGIPVIIKKLVYTIKTAGTGAGEILTINLYVGTTSKGALTVTGTDVALTVKTSSDINATVAAGSYIRPQLSAVATASDNVNAIGFLAVTYVEQYT